MAHTILSPDKRTRACRTPEASLRAEALERDLQEALCTMNGRALSSMAPSPCAVSTMTISGKLNVADVCPTQLLVAVDWMDSSTPLSTARCTRKPQFNNQVSVRYGTKSIKMFRNGSVHVTGCKTPGEFVQAVTAVCVAMTEAGIGDIVVESFSVLMINITFCANTTLRLQALRDKSLERGWQGSYDADIYPGLNLKIPVGARTVTALVFRSGNVILTGSKSPAEAVEAHDKLMHLLES